MHYKVRPELTSTNCSTEPSKTKLYMCMLNVTNSVEDEYKDFINLKPILI